MTPRLTPLLLLLHLSLASSEKNELDQVSVDEAAAHLMARFDIYGMKGPESPPDGMWHYQELARYVNASRRPEGEPLNVTASNMMLLMDTDKNSSITKDELAAFLNDLRDQRGLNGEEGRERARVRREEVRKSMEEMQKKQKTESVDGKTWVFGDHVEKPDKEALRRMEEGARSQARERYKAEGKQFPGDAKKTKKSKRKRKKGGSKDEL